MPTQDELPCSDGEPLETERHFRGMQLLIDSLKPWLQRRHEQTGDGSYIGGDMFLYFSLEQIKNRFFRGPDVFVVLGVEPGERKSWVVWDEGKAPDVVIELLSASTQKTDKQVKPRVYRDEVGVREYFLCDPFDLDDFSGFAFSSSERTSPGVETRSSGEDAGKGAGPAIEPNLVPDADGRIMSTVLGLQLGPWQGSHAGVDAVWLRWYTPEGELLLTDGEEHARRADEHAKRADELASKLRELGFDPDQLP